MSESVERLKKISGPLLGLAPQEVEDPNELRARIALLLVDLSGTINEIKDKQESIRLTAVGAAEVAQKAHSQGQEILAKLQTIDETTTNTNGKVKVLRSEMDGAKPDLQTLMKERTDKILDEESARLRREGLWVLPKTIKAWVEGAWVKAIKPALVFLGSVSLAWPALRYLWEHRIFWGH